MKRYLKKLVLFALTIFLVGCTTQKESGDLISKKEYDELQAKYLDVQEKYTDLLSSYSELEKEIQNLKATSNSVSDEKSEEKNVLLYSDEYIDIYYDHCEKYKFFESDQKYYVVLVVDNKTDYQISVHDDSLSTDGWNLSDAFVVQNFSQQSKGYLKVETHELQSMNPKSIGGSFRVYEDTKELFGKLYITIQFPEVEIVY